MEAPLFAFTLKMAFKISVKNIVYFGLKPATWKLLSQNYLIFLIYFLKIKQIFVSLESGVFEVSI